MIAQLLARGLIAGLVAGLLAFGIARVFGEPQVNLAIAFEEASEAAAPHEHAHDHDHVAGAQETEGQSAAPAGHSHGEEALVSRDTQAGLGLFVGVMVYATAVGGLFALAFAFCYGRVGALSARPLAALLALGAFIAFCVVPAIKYPPNPPAVGVGETIAWRTELHFILLFFTLVLIGLAAWLRGRLAASLGGWNAGIVAVAALVVAIGIVTALLPAVNEVPDDFSATLLWRFRMTAMGIQLGLWSVIGLVFGALAAPVVGERRRAAARAVFG
ncbi:CbtA family protein [Radicibacter daui]|uniref:CbtA family protein n=1 Tax=Radicibacter daui TaxID=3064829 RepID=UPI004046C005